VNRFATSLAVLALLPALATAQRKADPPADGLTIKGTYTLVVTGKPFDVVAPAGSKLYFWRLPDGWKSDVTEADAVATVTDAPNGTFDVSVVAVGADFTIKKYKLSVTIGAIPAPGPGPGDSLVKQMQDAYAADSTPNKADLARKIAAYYRAAARVCAGTYTTNGPLMADLAKAEQDAGATGLDSVRAVLRPEFRKVFPTDDPTASISATQLAAGVALYTRGAVALEGAK
jgi:hypothetical protein